MADPEKTTKERKPKGKQHLLVTPDGKKLLSSKVEKFYRDILEFETGAVEDEKAFKVTYAWPDPLQGRRLHMGYDSPICRSKCGLDLCGANNPYMPAEGPEKPLVTIIIDSVTRAEDNNDQLNTGASQGNYLYETIVPIAKKLGIQMDEIRWVPLTRCANYTKKPANYKIKGNWCRHFLIDDLRHHPPQLIIPMGTAALGALCHKSNAQDWGGKLLTYRGWPDDWLTSPKFMLPRPDPADPKEATVVGHPLYGPAPENIRIPLFPLQSVRLILAAQNPLLKKQWKLQLAEGLALARSGIKAKTYTRGWYRITEDVEEIEATLSEILKAPGIKVTFDTETTGLKPWADTAAVVFLMFRWIDPVTRMPRSIGFPWDFESIEEAHPNRVQPHMARLAPLVFEVLSQSTLIGHNLTFDILYTFGTFQKLWMGDLTEADPDYHRELNAILCALADAAKFDTWHMAYTLRQERGTLGLEALAYRFAPDLAGYEEDMTLLIKLHSDILHPDNGGHYANCPRVKWKTHFEPYVMGDVEVAHRARKELTKQLAESYVYAFPLADPENRGRFRLFEAPGRDWVYSKIMSPASRVLMKIMGRGMFIDQKELGRLEKRYPTLLAEDREKLRKSDPRIVAWCEEQERQNGPEWKFDLEKKDQLRAVLFERLKMPVQRLTKGGKALYGEEPEKWEDNVATALEQRLRRDPTEAEIQEELLNWAALDKFTLNKLAVDFEQIRPLQEYRKLFKLNSAYVAPLREAHLCRDGCIHASFMMTGTRGGRLSCRNPNLQQLPREGDVKSMFVSRFGQRGCLYQGDLSQIELRLLAAGCGDPSMVNAYHENVDLHTLTTSRIFNVPYENFEKSYFEKLQKEGRDKDAKDLNEKRQVGKTVNFLTGYGGGAFGLQTTLAARGIYKKIEECEAIIDAFFSAYPALQRHLGLYKKFIMKNAVAVSIFGRVRIFDEVWSSDNEAVSKAMRAGCNHLIQSTASDMMLIALTVIEDMMADAGLESMLVSTVHDSLIVDAVRDELPKVHAIVNRVLNNFHHVLPAVFGDDYDTSWMIVPFAGDCEVGPSYHDMRSIPKKDPDWDKIVLELDKKPE